MRVANERDNHPTLFISAGEPSGDLHGSNLMRALHARAPHLRMEGFGGERMAAAGCDLHYPLAAEPLIGFASIARHVPRLAQLISKTNRHFRKQRPVGVVLIDNPGFNWWIARRAHEAGIPVFYFVPPQIWGWANWRVDKMRRWVDHVLCTLPFEKAWYEARGVAAHYIGHPFFDDLRQQKLDDSFLARQSTPGQPVLAILPGSRRHELKNNFVGQLETARHLHQRHPGVRFLVGCFRTDHADFAVECARGLFGQTQPASGDYSTGLRGGWEFPLDICVGRTPEILQLAHSCLSVSGSVSLEMLFRGKPAVVMYRASRIMVQVYHLLRTVPYISLVNLLANKLLYPELVTHKFTPAQLAEPMLQWLSEPARYDQLCRELLELRDRVAEPGACVRGAEYILQTIQTSSLRAA